MPGVIKHQIILILLTAASATKWYFLPEQGKHDLALRE